MGYSVKFVGSGDVTFVCMVTLVGSDDVISGYDIKVAGN